MALPRPPRAPTWLERAQPQVPREYNIELGPGTRGNIVANINFRLTKDKVLGPAHVYILYVFVPVIFKIQFHHFIRF